MMIFCSEESIGLYALPGRGILNLLFQRMARAFYGTLSMASASAGSRYTPITVHCSGAYLEYDLHEQIREDRLPTEAECALPFPGGSNSGSGSFSYRRRPRYHLPTECLATLSRE
jgi:hypothetical protein